MGKRVNLDWPEKTRAKFAGFVFEIYESGSWMEVFYPEDADEIVKYLSAHPEKVVDDEALNPDYWRKMKDHCALKFTYAMKPKRGGKRKGKGKLNKSYQKKYDLKRSLTCIGKCPDSGQKCVTRKGVVRGKVLCACL